MPNAVVNDSGYTIFELRTHGESCTFMPVIVPRKGFNFSLDAARTKRGYVVNLGYIVFSFENTSINSTLLQVDETYEDPDFEIDTYIYSPDEDPVYRSFSGVLDDTITTFAVLPNGKVAQTPWYTDRFFKIPSIESLPVFGTDESMIKMKISWGNVTSRLDLIFPPEVRFIMPSLNTTDTTAATTTTETTRDTSTPQQTVEKRFLDKNWSIVVQGIGIVFVFSGVVVTALLIYKIVHLIKNIPLESMTLVTETCNNPASTLTGQQNESSTMPDSSTVDPSSVPPSSEPQNPQTTIAMETGEDLVFIAKASKSTLKKKKSNPTD